MSTIENTNKICQFIFDKYNIEDEETITLYFFDSQIENYFQIGFINNRLKCLDKFGVIVEIAITENKLLIFYNKKKWREFQK